LRSTEAIYAESSIPFICRINRVITDYPDCVWGTPGTNSGG
jgi:hypothetical protein